MGVVDDLHRAREACERREWVSACRRLSDRDQSHLTANRAGDHGVQRRLQAAAAAFAYEQERPTADRSAMSFWVGRGSAFGRPENGRSGQRCVWTGNRVPRLSPWQRHSEVCAVHEA